MKRYPAKIFFCYSHKDEGLRDELEKHLKMMERQGLIINWHDRRIVPGKNWSNTIDANLENSDIVLPLLSPDFLASDYCMEVEMKRAIELHNHGQLRIVPILMRICDWQNSEFGKFQGLPMDMKPVKSSEWFSEDEAFYTIVHGLKDVINEFFEETETISEIIGNVNLSSDSVNRSNDLYNYNKLRIAMLALRAANHKLRNRICTIIIKNKALSLDEIVSQLKFDPNDKSVISQHLAILRRAGIVNTKGTPKSIYYIIDTERIKTINDAVDMLN
jgi:DNA-binding transcriptional ArsR family regulator